MRHLWYTFVLLLLCGLRSATCADAIDFDRDIAPLLANRCLGCHFGADAEGKLNLGNRSAAFAGGESGAAIQPGDLAGSLIWQRVAADEMPEDKPLSEHEKQTLRRWIEQGARWGDDPIDPLQFTTDARAGYDWWSLQALREPSIPIVKNTSWIRNPIDAFVLAKLEAAGLSPSPEAKPAELVRRVYFNVIGLPPPLDVLAKLDRPPQDWYARLVDELLASPLHGQRWARHWLDVVRFGESHGFEYNQPRDTAWHYRNWVIDALNADLPYDQFARLQIAGDVLAPDDYKALSAVGFLVAGPHNTTKPDNQQMRMTMRHDELEDIVGTIGQTFLGLTVNCARCHDHKFDPVTQREYYQLVAAVAGIDHGQRDIPGPAQARAQRAEARRASLKKREEAIQVELDSAGESQAARRKELDAQLDAIRLEKAELQKIEVEQVYTAISKQPPPVHRLRRGDVRLAAELVAPSGIAAVNPSYADFQLSEAATDGERRQKLAQWITGPENALFARVLVNRLWHYHFGEGLVRTPSDFGFNGDRPSHPELLDYLAVYLIRADWQIKPLHRLILTSATYRQASLRRPRAADVDAENRLLWRVHPRRLTAEEIRDAILSVAGVLDHRLGGAGYRDVREYKYRGSHFYDPIEPTGPESNRRTVYRFRPRGARRNILDTFDCPDPSAKAPKRAVTITPLQALSLLNHHFVMDMARQCETRIKSEATSPRAQIDRLFLLVYGRPAGNLELDQAEEFVQKHSLADLSRVLFNSNEFLHAR